MRFIEQIVILKNGKSVTIRETMISDTSELLLTIKTYLSDSEYIPREVNEFDLTIEEGENWINSLITKSNSLSLVATYNGVIIGNIELTGSNRVSMSHTAYIGMGILNEWRNIGLGSKLMEISIDWAKANDDIELLWLQVYTENKSAIKLYENMGFASSGVIKNYFKQNGKYFDNLTMNKSL